MKKKITSILNTVFTGTLIILEITFLLIVLARPFKMSKLYNIPLKEALLNFEGIHNPAVLYLYLGSIILMIVSILIKYIVKVKKKEMTFIFQLIACVLSVISLVASLRLISDEMGRVIILFLIFVFTISILVTSIKETFNFRKNKNKKEENENDKIDLNNLNTYEVIEEGGKIMVYTHLEVRPKDFDKKVNAMAQQGWKVVCQSESTWEIHKCCGLSNTVDSIINVTLVKGE